MKVALLSDCYLPRLGGIEVQVHDLAAQLRAAGHEVAVFTATLGPQGQRHGVVEVVDDVPVHRLALRLPWRLPVNPLAPKELRARLRAGGFDVAHVHAGLVSPFAWDAVRVTMDLSLPTVITWHCMLHGYQRIFRGFGTLRRWADAGATLSAVSQAAAQPLRDIVGPGVPISVLPNGIDVQRWRPARRVPDRAADRGDGVVRIVTAMRLAARKRPVPMLAVVAAARARVPASTGIHLEILGEGPDRAAVERAIAARGMSSWVSLPGRVTREELAQRYASADVYLSPARLESFGIAALEARTAGLPVVGRAGSGIAEFVTDGVGGVIAPDDEAMAAGLARLIGQPDLRAAMTAHNLDVPPSQSWPEVVAAAEREYRAAGERMGKRRS